MIVAAILTMGMLTYGAMTSTYEVAGNNTFLTLIAIQLYCNLLLFIAFMPLLFDIKPYKYNMIKKCKKCGEEKFIRATDQKYENILSKCENCGALYTKKIYKSHRGSIIRFQSAKIAL